MFKVKKLNMKAIYEHRHLFTDDVHYNSLVTSILINEPIKLVSLEHFINLDTSVKKKIIHDFFIVFIQLDGLTFFSIQNIKGVLDFPKLKRLGNI